MGIVTCPPPRPSTPRKVTHPPTSKQARMKESKERQDELQAAADVPPSRGTRGVLSPRRQRGREQEAPPAERGGDPGGARGLQLAAVRHGGRILRRVAHAGGRPSRSRRPWRHLACVHRGHFRGRWQRRHRDGVRSYSYTIPHWAQVSENSGDSSMFSFPFHSCDVMRVEKKRLGRGEEKHQTHACVCC